MSAKAFLVFRIFSLLTAIVGAPWLAGAQEPVDPARQLIVLIAAGEDVPRPEEVVDAVRNHQPVPCGLGQGDPEAAELTVKERAEGRTRALMDYFPDAPFSLRERYLLLTYPEGTDLETLRPQLIEDPDVLNAERNAIFHSHAAVFPSDPLFGQPGSPPTSHQWGSHLLKLPEAWELTKGHAMVGLIDYGVATTHPDLRTFFRQPDGTLLYVGGPIREHLSEDFRFDDCNVDELDPGDGVSRNRAGHGSHVAGIVAATSDNGQGVAGACWNCSLLITKFITQGDGNPEVNPPQSSIFRAVRSLGFTIDQGAQIASMSFGLAQEPCQEVPINLSFFCNQLQMAQDRDVLLTASVGNDKAAVEFPANDPRVVAVGGIEPMAGNSSVFAFWDEAPFCPFIGTIECGSNFGAEQELMAPAKSVLSTMYPGFDHNVTLGCGDSTLAPVSDGYGLCTGTSMSSPYVAGVAALVRSVFPLLTVADVRDILTSTASNGGSHNNQLGYGVPNARAAVEKALGKVDAKVLPNRLTPFFSLYSPLAQAHVYTTSPSAAMAFFFDPFEPFDPVGPLVTGYPAFPDPHLKCVVSPCDNDKPSASLFLFTSDVSPFPGAPPLVPVYRVRYDPNLPFRCDNPQPERVHNRDFTVTTTAAGIVHFKENATDANGIGYELDGIEGYIFGRCEPEPQCIPEGAERVYRLYHPQRDDHAVFPESELATKLAQGYVSQPQQNAWIGYAYPNVDSDGDGLIDAWENLLGTKPLVADTDCDGTSDGEEVMVYDREEHRYGDPLDGPCIRFFVDDFESGDTSKWSAVEGVL